MLSGKARKDLAAQNDAARRNQLSMAKLKELCESPEWRADIQRSRAAAAAAPKYAVPPPVTTKTPQEVSLEAARARLCSREIDYSIAREQARSTITLADESIEPKVVISPLDSNRCEHLESTSDTQNWMDCESVDDDSDDTEPVLAWGPSGRKPGLFTNSDGNLRSECFFFSLCSSVTAAISGHAEHRANEMSNANHNFHTSSGGTLGSGSWLACYMRKRGSVHLHAGHTRDRTSTSMYTNNDTLILEHVRIARTCTRIHTHHSH